MRSGYGNAGNVKMRGRKRYHLFPCQCCWCEDDREKLLKKIVNKEKHEAITDYEMVKKEYS